MENFELKYKSALSSATTMYACAQENNDKEMIQSLELIFPELKKNEDELMREELIHFLETCQDSRFVGNRKRDEWIKWLEKQGQQKSNNESKQQWSCEDENMFACLWRILNWVEKSNYSSTKSVGKYIDWLQSLK